jgi:hypothetical protein
MSEQAGQNYANHRKVVPMYHYFMLPLITVTLIGSFVNLGESIVHKEGLYSASLISALSLFCTVAFLYMRSFALRAQDRAIRAEENFRHYLLTGKPHDSRLRMGQIIALRFAPDDEMPNLAIKAAVDGLKAEEIKKAIKNWKGDYHRL